MDITAIQNKLRATFREEAEELLAELDGVLLTLEHTPQDTVLLQQAFRIMHTIKGSGATSGFNEIAAFTHHIEELLEAARQGKLTLTAESIDIILSARDIIGRMLQESPCPETTKQAEALIKKLQSFLPQSLSKSSVIAQESFTVAETLRTFRIFFKPPQQIFFSGTDPLNFLAEISELGAVKICCRLENLPPFAELNPELCYLAWEIELTTTRPLEQIKEIFVFIEDESEISIVPVPAANMPDVPAAVEVAADIVKQNVASLNALLPQLNATGTPQIVKIRDYLRVLKTIQKGLDALPQLKDAFVLAAAQVQLVETAINSGENISTSVFENMLAGGKQLIEKLSHGVCGGNMSMAMPNSTSSASTNTAGRAGGNNTLRVDQEKLERLMRTVGELLITRNALTMLAKRATGGIARELKENAGQISHIADELQNTVMSIRMLPVRLLFQRFPRVVRDLARQLKKEIKLVLEGEETELDKTIIEQLGDPLVHLVRNAVDHGIESPEERLRAGKPQAGTIILRAYTKGANVIIEIRDDGRGLDAEKLIAKAVAKNLISPAYAAGLSKEAAYELIFLPGFSTAEQVSDVSGRGVGMDVVRTNVRQLRGHIQIESKLGQGTAFLLILPAGMLVSRIILVEARQTCYGVPIESVVELAKVPRQQLHIHCGDYFVAWRGGIYHVVCLADCLKGQSRDEQEDYRADDIHLAIIETGAGREAVVVNRFLGETDVIVKPLPHTLAKIKAFLGSAILGSGDIVLVINPAELNGKKQEGIRHARPSDLPQSHSCR